MSKFEIIPIKWEIAKTKFQTSDALALEEESSKEYLALQINIESGAFQEIYLGAILSKQKCFILANLCMESKGKVLALLNENFEHCLNKDVVLHFCGDCRLYIDEAVSEALWIILRQFAYVRGVILDLV